jgi:hypothetical protein
MNAQDLYPFDSTKVGLNKIFHTVGDDSFYINSPCLIVHNKIVSKKKHYILFYNPKGTGLTMADVILLDGYYKEGIVHLFVQDIQSHRIFIMDQSMEYSEDQCQFFLVDLNYFIDKLNFNAIQSYCGCNKTTNKPETKLNSKSSRGDLLDFDF